jgi:predicted AlkP superfamily phosphohydrolase/phosphomutase
MRPPILLIGLDGATFSILDPLMASGGMPRLKELIASGARSELASVIPALTPPAWTSLMTGRSPGNHGIFDFLRFELRSGERQLRVLNSDDVTCPTIWSILARHGRNVTVLNFPMTFPARGISGNVVPGWVPWRHLRLACHPKTLYERLTAVLPDFNPRQLAMDMSLEERALEGCYREEDYENLIKLHIQRERQWFDILRYLMREEPADLTAILFDGVDKLQHFCWRFLDRTLSPSPSGWESRVREWCLDYFREIDDFIGEIVSMGGADASVVIASDHGFGPTVEVFYLNAWLHQHGYLAWADAAHVEQKHPETLGMGTMARRFYEIDWDRTTAYCPSPSSNGIYICLPPGEGNKVAPDSYERFRRDLMESLLQFCDPATGERVVTRIWTREEAFAGKHMASAPDLTLNLRDGGLVSILPSEILLKARREPSGAHRPNGVFVAAGQGIRRGASLSSLSIVDIAPLLLYMLDLPVPNDMEGCIPKALFDSEYLRAHPVAFAIPTPSSSPAAPFRDVDLRLEEQVLSQLRALGYME